MVRRNVAQLSADEFVGQAVKTIAPHALVRNFTREREGIAERALRLVKSRIEAGYLWNVRSCRGDRIYGGEVMRLMQRSERT